MPNVPAFTHDYGDFTDFQPKENIEKVWNPDGSYAEYKTTVYHPVNQAIRKSKTSNPLTNERGFPWRNPSGYRRSVGRKIQTMGLQTQSINGYYREDRRYFREWLFDGDFEQGAFGDWPMARWSDELESEAIAKCIAKIKDKKFSMGENLGESLKTYESLVGHSMEFIYALRSVKHGNWKLAGRHLMGNKGLFKRGADLFLEYKYGWKPLMSDIYGAYTALDRALKQGAIITALGSAKENIGFPSHSDIDRSGTATRSCQVRLWGQLSDLSSRMTDVGGISNPLSLAWELTPLSMFVDWFVPIGSSLDSLTAPAGVDFLGGYATTRGETNFTSTLLADQGWTGNRGSNVNQSIDINRRTYAEWPKAGLYTANPFTRSHGETTFALLLQSIFK